MLPITAPTSGTWKWGTGICFEDSNFHRSVLFTEPVVGSVPLRVVVPQVVFTCPMLRETATGVKYLGEVGGAGQRKRDTTRKQGKLNSSAFLAQNEFLARSVALLLHEFNHRRWEWRFNKAECNRGRRN